MINQTEISFYPHTDQKTYHSHKLKNHHYQTLLKKSSLKNVEEHQRNLNHMLI